MKTEVRVKGIVWGDRFSLYAGPEEKPVYPGVDGAVEYEVTMTRSPEELAGEKTATMEEYEAMTQEQRHQVSRINPYTHTIFQPFKLGSIYKAEHGYVWGWDGNRDAPSLSPSLLSDWRTAAGGCDACMHIYFTAGRIVDSGSINVVYA